MSTTQTLVPHVLDRMAQAEKQEVGPGYQTEYRILIEFCAVALGVILISLMAQIVIRLPGTPVPITGQTFGVALTALLWGRRRAFAVMGSYLFLGYLGLPLLAGGAVLSAGPSVGYLAGMMLATLVVGELADRGFSKTWGRAFLSATLGSVVVFSLGLWVLSYFVPHEALLAAGLWPFLPGDILKNALASFIASRAGRWVR